MGDRVGEGKGATYNTRLDHGSVLMSIVSECMHAQLHVCLRACMRVHHYESLWACAVVKVPATEQLPTTT